MAQNPKQITNHPQSHHFPSKKHSQSHGHEHSEVSLDIHLIQVLSVDIVRAV